MQSYHQPDTELTLSGGKMFLKVKVKISVSSDDEETLKYQIYMYRSKSKSEIAIGQPIPLIKGIHYPDTGQALLNTSTQSV